MAILGFLKDKLAQKVSEKLAENLVTAIEAAGCSAMAGAGTAALDYLNSVSQGQPVSMQQLQKSLLLGAVGGFVLYWKTPRAKRTEMKNDKATIAAITETGTCDPKL